MTGLLDNGFSSYVTILAVRMRKFAIIIIIISIIIVVVVNIIINYLCIKKIKTIFYIMKKWCKKIGKNI